MCKSAHGHDRIDFEKLREKILYWFNSKVGQLYPFRADLIRMYYYDAIVDKKHSDYDTQREYFDSIEERMLYTVKLGELIESSKQELKQKGVDILIAIDSLTMAYQNHYDVGMFLMGDRDFVPLIEAIKSAWKTTVGVFRLKHTARELIKSWDMRVHISDADIQSFLK